MIQNFQSVTKDKIKVPSLRFAVEVKQVVALDEDYLIAEGSKEQEDPNQWFNRKPDIQTPSKIEEEATPLDARELRLRERNREIN